MVTAAWMLLGFLAGLGVLSLAEWLLAAISRPVRVRCVHILPVQAGVVGLEQLLRWAYNGLQWGRWFKGGRLVVLDLGAAREEREIIAAFCHQHSGVVCCTMDTFPQVIQDADVCKTLQVVLY